MKRIAPGAFSLTRSAACGLWSTSKTLSPRSRKPRTAARPIPVAPPATMILPIRLLQSAGSADQPQRQTVQATQARLQPELRGPRYLDALYLARERTEEYLRFEPRDHLCNTTVDARAIADLTGRHPARDVESIRVAPFPRVAARP